MALNSSAIEVKPIRRSCWRRGLRWSSIDMGRTSWPFEADAAQVWGRLRVPNPGHEMDKQIAAIALVNDLTVVTRNTADFKGIGVKLINPLLPVVGKL